MKVSQSKNIIRKSERRKEKQQPLSFNNDSKKKSCFNLSDFLCLNMKRGKTNMYSKAQQYSKNGCGGEEDEICDFSSSDEQMTHM